MALARVSVIPPLGDRSRAVLRDGAWLIADRVVRLGVGVWIVGWLGRHLGPEQFGTWSHALAVIALATAFTSLGMDHVVVRELVHRPLDRVAILASAAWLRLGGGAATWLLACAGAWILVPGDALTLALVALVGLGQVAQCGMVADLDLQSRQDNRRSVIAQQIAFHAMAAAKLILLAAGAPLLAFAVVGMMEWLVATAAVAIAHRWAHGPSTLLAARRGEMRILLAASWPLLLGLLATGIAMRADQVLVHAWLGDAALGQYSAAVRISELWLFIPSSLCTALAPGLARMERDDPVAAARRWRQLLLLTAVGSLAVAAGLAGLAPWLIALVFGADYAPSGALLRIHALTALFIPLSVLTTLWLTIHDRTRTSLIRTLIGVVVGLGLALILIPSWGATGAAVAAVLMQAAMLAATAVLPGAAGLRRVLRGAALARPECGDTSAPPRP